MDISVVIPVYNAEKYLRKCLDSICAQAECVKEIILVNDGSTDDSLNICKEYEEHDRRIKIISRSNKGTAASIIDGVRVATSDYVGFMDSDDYIEPNMFGELADCAVKTNADVVICDYDLVDENGYHYARRDLGMSGEVYDKIDGRFPIKILPTLNDGRFISASRWNKIFRRELVMNNSGLLNTDIRMGEDLVLVIPVVMSAQRLAHVDKCLYHYVQRKESITHDYRRSNLNDWQKSINLLVEASVEYDYKLNEIDSIALALLLQNCLSKIKSSCLSKKQKKAEYKYIGENELVRKSLNNINEKMKFRKKIIFGLLKHELYGLLATIY